MTFGATLKNGTFQFTSLNYFWSIGLVLISTSGHAGSNHEMGHKQIPKMRKYKNNQHDFYIIFIITV